MGIYNVHMMNIHCVIINKNPQNNIEGSLWLRNLISPLVSLDHCIISHSLITSSNFHFGIFWPLYYQSFFDYVFYLPLWYHLDIVLSVILFIRLLISPLASFDHCIISHSLIRSSNFHFGVFWPLNYQSFFDYVF